MKKLLLLSLPLFMMIGIMAYSLHARGASLCIRNNGVAAVGALHYNVTLAVTPAEWERGLSGTPQLPADEGMLFLFPDAAVRSFWMKDMRYPLDIVWIDGKWEVVGIAHHATPESYPKTFTSPEGVQRVLEIASTDDSESPVRIGDVVHFNCL